MDSSLIERTPAWLRWILVLPASVLTYLLVTAAVIIGGKLMSFFTTGAGWSENFFQYLAAPAIAGYCSVAAAVILAPSSHRAVLLGVLAVWMACYGVLGGAATFTGDLKSLAAVVISVAGALFALTTVENRY